MMRRAGWIVGALVAVMALIGIGLYVSGNQTDTVIVPQSVNQSEDGQGNGGADDSADSDATASSTDDSTAPDREDYKLYGTLVALNEQDVTISFNGKESTYRLADKHEIDEDTPRVGDRVKLELNQRDEVTEVDRETEEDDDSEDSTESESDSESEDDE